MMWRKLTEKSIVLHNVCIFKYQKNKNVAFCDKFIFAFFQGKQNINYVLTGY